MVRVCGPKLSGCCAVLGAWGVIQLSLMGVFFYTKSVELVEDIPLNDTYASPELLSKAMSEGYTQNAYNCWIAALLYLLTVAFSVQQFWSNQRQSS